MRTNLPPQTQTASSLAARGLASWRFLSLRPFNILLVPAASLVLCAAQALLPAQTPTTQTSAPETTSVPKPVHRHQRPSAAKPLSVPSPAAAEAVTRPAPETPNWPAFDKPALASVVWDSHGLSIDAANSSLEQILKDVSTATGAKVEGLTSDQRVFGAYGPGQARDVLSQLLQGSGFNVLMIGDQGEGAPREILLSARQTGANQPAARDNPANNEEDDVEEQPAPQDPGPNRPSFTPGTAPRSPQQIMQEMQQRQQQMQQPGQPAQPAQPGQQPPASPQN
jgi:hypothetical protein